MSMARRIGNAMKFLGLRGVAASVAQRLRPRRLAIWGPCEPLLAGRSGLEIGGPSAMFTHRGWIPVYPIAARIDNCNFSKHTVWGEHRDGRSFRFAPDKDPGRQYICEASDLAGIASDSAEFVLSSHMLEHSANPLKVLAEWVRVLKADGLLAVVVPHRDGTFDHRRPVTAFEHLVEDFRQDVSEADLSHVPEILALHDLWKDPEAGDPAAFRERALHNLENRCLHQHVFDPPLAARAVDHAGLQILSLESFRPFHIAVVARKAAPGVPIDNTRFLGRPGPEAWTSPFPSDR
jgi:SAM-dependent methyltransferase